MNLERRSSLKNVLLFFIGHPRAISTYTLAESESCTKNDSLQHTEAQLTTNKYHLNIVSPVFNGFKTVVAKYFTKRCLSQLLMIRRISKLDHYMLDYHPEKLKQQIVLFLHVPSYIFSDSQIYNCHFASSDFREKESILSDYNLDSRERFKL